MAVIMMAVIMMVAMIMVSPVAVVVVLMIPMALVHSPAFAVVVVMRMTPVCPFVWRTIPASPDPAVTWTNWFPISVHPDKLLIRSTPTLLIADRRGRGPEAAPTLCRTWGYES